MMSRIPNFTYQEKVFLIKLVAEKYQTIIEDKKTNRSSVDDKKNAWKDIEREFNASGPHICFRSAETLRRLYDNKKKELRRKLAEEKKQRLLTGGGNMPSDKLDDLDEILISILNEKTLTGLSNQFDCDSEGISTKDVPSEYVFEWETNSQIQTDVLIIDNEVEHGQKSVTNTSQQEDKENIEELDKKISGSRTGCVQEWKKLKIDDLKRPLTSALRTSTLKRKAPNEEEIVEQKSETPKSSSRRRPMITRALTTSDVAQKYNVLLDKRLELVNKNLLQQDANFKFQQEEQKLKLQLLNLEIEYKKTVLRTNFGIESVKI